MQIYRVTSNGQTTYAANAKQAKQQANKANEQAKAQVEKMTVPVKKDQFLAWLNAQSPAKESTTD